MVKKRVADFILKILSIVEVQPFNSEIPVDPPME